MRCGHVKEWPPSCGFALEGTSVALKSPAGASLFSDKLATPTVERGVYEAPVRERSQWLNSRSRSYRLGCGGRAAVTSRTS
eukprot:scaffold63258_cov59-Phaeocystis_antarctica.AAC.2